METTKPSLRTSWKHFIPWKLLKCLVPSVCVLTNRKINETYCNVACGLLCQQALLLKLLCCFVLYAGHRTSPILSQTECTPKQNKDLTKWFFYFQNRNSTNRTSITLRGAVQTGTNMRTRWQDSTFFTFKTNLALQRRWGNMCFRCWHSASIREYR